MGGAERSDSRSPLSSPFVLWSSQIPVRVTQATRRIEMLIKVEGLLDEKGHVVSPKNKPAINRMSEANDMELQRLLDLAQEKETG